MADEGVHYNTKGKADGLAKTSLLQRGFAKGVYVKHKEGDIFYAEDITEEGSVVMRKRVYAGSLVKKAATENMIFSSRATTSRRMMRS